MKWTTLETPKRRPCSKTMRGTVFTTSRLRKKQLGIAVMMWRCLPRGRYVREEQQGQGVEPPEHALRQMNLRGIVSGGQSG